jgi:hypothetical protein
VGVACVLIYFIFHFSLISQDDEDQPEEIESDIQLYPGLVRSRIRFNVSRAVNLTCRARNVIGADERIDSRMVTLDLLPRSGKDVKSST